MNPRQLAVPLLLIVMGWGLGSIEALSTAAYSPKLLFAMGLLGAAAVLRAEWKAPKGAALGPLVDALRSVARGKRPTVPENVEADLLPAFDQVEQIARQRIELADEVARLEAGGAGSGVNVTQLVQAAEKAKHGDRPRAPAGAPAEAVELYEELGTLAEAIAAHTEEQKRQKDELAKCSERANLAEQDAKARRTELATVTERLAASEQDLRAARGEVTALSDRVGSAEQEARTRRADQARELGDIADAAQRAGDGERVRVPPGVSSETARVFGEIAVLAERVTEAEAREKARASELAQAAGAIEDAFPRLAEGVTSVLTASEQATGHIREMTTALANK